MKKFFYLIFAAVIMFCCCGCSSEKKENTSDMVMQYSNYAQQCIAEGKTDEAKSVLEEGIAKTGSEELKKLLEELNGDTTSNDISGEESNIAHESNSSKVESTVSENNSIDDYLKYIGNWRVPGSADYYSNTELTLNIAVKDNKMALILRYADISGRYDYDETRKNVAEISKVIELSEIKDNVLVVKYDDDGCGNSGEITFNFLNETTIICESDYYVQDDYYWGFGFSMSKLEKNKSAEDMF